MAESEKNDTEEQEAEAYKGYLLDESGADLTETLEQVPNVSREDLKDTRRLSVDDMRKLAEDKG